MVDDSLRSWPITVELNEVELGFLRAIEARDRPYSRMRYANSSWNVRGLNNPQKRGVGKNWLREWICDVVCLQETKLDKVDWSLVRSIWGNKFIDWEFLNANHTVGGVLLMWDKHVLEKHGSCVGNFSVYCYWKGISIGFEWVGTGLYGPHDDDHRRELWDELQGIRNQWNYPWFTFGDFNVVRFPNERLGCSQVSPSMMEFSDVIEELNLVDLPLRGGSYTWSNGATNPSMSRIDRVLNSVDWEEFYPDFIQKLLPRPISDHFPILVEVPTTEGGEGMARRKNSFKFENM